MYKKVYGGTLLCCNESNSNFLYENLSEIEAFFEKSVKGTDGLVSENRNVTDFLNG